eukprot:m51a1_g5865 hypothetical protein (371) ;mRNA; r:392230-393965
MDYQLAAAAGQGYPAYAQIVPVGVGGVGAYVMPGAAPAVQIPAGGYSGYSGYPGYAGVNLPPPAIQLIAAPAPAPAPAAAYDPGMSYVAELQRMGNTRAAEALLQVISARRAKPPPTYVQVVAPPLPYAQPAPLPPYRPAMPVRRAAPRPAEDPYSAPPEPTSEPPPDQLIVDAGFASAAPAGSAVPRGGHRGAPYGRKVYPPETDEAVLVLRGLDGLATRESVLAMFRCLPASYVLGCRVDALRGFATVRFNRVSSASSALDSVRRSYPHIAAGFYDARKLREKRAMEAQRFAGTGARGGRHGEARRFVHRGKQQQQEAQAKEGGEEERKTPPPTPSASEAEEEENEDDNGHAPEGDEGCAPAGSPRST